jgi:hypothetical protein
MCSCDSTPAARRSWPVSRVSLATASNSCRDQPCGRRSRPSPCWRRVGLRARTIPPTKTAPVQFEEFAPLVDWWDKRKKNDRAWKVPAAELLAAGCNLDRKNPSAKEDITHLPPEQLAASILEKEQRIAQIVGRIQGLLAKQEQVFP